MRHELWFIVTCRHVSAVCHHMCLPQVTTECCQRSHSRIPGPPEDGGPAEGRGEGLEMARFK
eukprot:scaffold237523_cov19-Tisochrysis_lutea.AAC.1